MPEEAVATGEVLPYSPDLLDELLIRGKYVIQRALTQKLHSIYFKEYFDYLKAATIIIERNYVDRDFLEDYSGYYVRCFAKYEKVCVRLHFFNKSFKQEEFESVLENRNAALTVEDLQNSYLGFIVIKPLPVRNVGRTCLVCYEPEGQRYYPVKKKYKVHLFGIPLYVESLAFQEQDTVTAACATSAIWTAFHGTERLFNNPIPSPVEITKVATKLNPPITRVMPNKGLDAWHLAQAIREVGLEPSLINANDDYVAKSNMYAYLKAGIPLLLGLDLTDISTKTHEPMGYHAVTVSGYNLPDGPCVPYGNGFLMKASKIQKIYAHDDEIGPFSRIIIRPDFYQGSWRGKSWKIGSAIAQAILLLIPLYHKIRIPFKHIFKTIYMFDILIEEWRNGTGSLKGGGRFEWDIYLTTVNEFKNWVREIPFFDGKYRKSVLQMDMPRFLWRATACHEGEMMLDLMFDATDIEHGSCFFHALPYSSDLADGLKAFSPSSAIESVLSREPVWQIYEWFRKID